MNDEFYIGWEAKATTGISRTVRKVVVALLILALLVPVVLAVSQRMIGNSVFEWGNHKSFSGILQAKPYPLLLVPRPGNAGALPHFSTYYLVAPWKFGLDQAEIAPLDGKSVTLKGTLIYRENQTMIETKPDWIQATETNSGIFLPPQPIQLGKQTLVGEIVDSKCFLGVMNPGQLTPHRGCAIRCISGGVPPVLLVRRKNGPAIYLLLVSADGNSVNKRVLDMIAEPLEITGEVERQGELLICAPIPQNIVEFPSNAPINFLFRSLVFLFFGFRVFFAVSLNTITQKAQQFIAQYIHSVEQLEIFLTLAERKDSPISVSEIFKKIQSNEKSVFDCLEYFLKEGLVIRETDGQYRRSEIHDLVEIGDELKQAYRERHVTVIEMIYKKPPGPVQNFADAFRFRKDK